ncbi:MAG: PLDc N-terminal domain-containing protein [Clostridia bacterium]|nr:PLDc N-terminal domain-containing protein [Clostridia bacterium]
MKKICRVLFSRYALSALAIVLQVAVMIYLFIFAASSRVYISLASMLLSVVAFLSLVNRETNPEYKIPWSFIILTITPAGAILYFLFYKRKLTRKEAKRLRCAVSRMRRRGFISEECTVLSRIDPQAAGKVNLILKEDALADVYRGTSSRFFATGEEYFESFIKDISEAKDYIFLEYFIIDEGELWSKIHGILKEKAEAGVDVRLLYDDFGCMRTLPSRYERTLRKEGIQTYRFSRVSAKVSSIHNNRDHRKICVVDGKYAYTGGVNIADEYANIISRFGYWKDGGIRIEGQAVLGFIKLFLSSWDLTAGCTSDYQRFADTVSMAESPDGGFYIPYGSGPAPIYRTSNGKNVFITLINQAEKYVYFTTPYLIIDYDLTEALRGAAMRGVDVRIITPGIPDKKRVKIMTKSSYPKLVEAGVKIYEYIPGFMHEKTFISDDKYAVVGTINFDYRSFVHHFENAVLMYSTPTVAAALNDFKKTLTISDRVSFEHTRLSFIEWIFKIGMRIFAPLL